MKLLVALVTLLHVSQHALGVEVVVTEGAESVLLPCQVTVTDPKDNSVLWSLKRLSDQIVHQREQSGDRLRGQNQNYANRTSMRTDSLTTGVLSLTLKKPTTRDSDIYICIYKEGLDTKSRHEVHLKVTIHPGVITGKVLGAVLCLLAVVAVGLWAYMKWDEGRVQQVKVEEGEESVLLPLKWTDRWWVKMRMCRICCICDLSKDVTVEWTDMFSNKLHVCQNGSDQPEEQVKRYRDRTEMKKDLMKTGDFSLILKEPRLKDTGIYYCRVYNKKKVLLRVRRVYLEVTVQQVKVEEGKQSVLLPVKWTDRWWVKMRMCRICCICGLSKVVTVEWTDRANRKLHVYENGSDQPGEQDEHYRGRTEMKTGDFSLTLMKPIVKDTGIYYWRVYNKKGDLLRVRTVYLDVTGQQVEEKAESVKPKPDRSMDEDSIMDNEDGVLPGNQQVKEGKDSVLMNVKIAANQAKDVRVEFKDKDNRTVHVYENGSDRPQQQDPVYTGRTLMQTDFILTLKDLRERDSGTYTCTVSRNDNKGDVLREKKMVLKVEGKKKPSPPGTEATPLVADQAV